MKLTLQFSRIAWKLIAALIVFSSLVTLITTAIQLFSEYNRDIDAIQSRFHQVERSYLMSITENVWEADKDRLTLLINGILALPDFRYAVIREENGATLVSAGKEESLQVIRHVYPLHYHFREKDIKIGELEVVATLSEVFDRIFERIGLILVSNAVKTFMVAIFLFIVIHWILTRHLAQMVAFAREMNFSLPTAAIHLERRFMGGKRDEMDDLADSLNDMRARLLKSFQDKQESEKDYRTILNNLIDTFYRTDTDGRITMISPSVIELLGYSPEELRGRKLSDYYVNPDDREIFLNVLHKQGGKLRGFDRKLKHKDGSVVWVSSSSNYYHDDEGEILGVEGVARNITEKKLAEEAVKEAQSQLSELIRIAPEAILSISDKSEIILFNRGGERIFGHRAEEVVGKPFEILMPGRFRQRHHVHMNGFLHSGDDYRLMDHRQEIIGLKKDGTEFPASASVSKSKSKDGYQFTVIMHDLTERRNSEESRRKALIEAEKANRAKSEFLASMSHELRTPLNSILGFSEIIRHQYLGTIGEEKYIDYAENIHLSGRHLLNLVNQILDIERIEAGEYTIIKESIDIQNLLNECQIIIGMRADSKNISLSFEYPENIPPLRADRRAILQVLINLLTNAVKFTPEGGNIILKVTNTPQYYLIEVTDTGVGIPDDKLKTIMTPFTRHESDPHKPQEGVGLGLAITKALIELHDGKLKIESKPPIGTVITAVLPIELS